MNCAKIGSFNNFIRCSDLMITLLEFGLTLLTLGSISFYIACAFCTYHFFAIPEPLPQLRQPPPVGVSILVAVRGLDVGAWDNWLSLCQQNWRTYEVLFGVTDPEDLAVPLLQKLAAQFPEHVRVFVGLRPRGINLKDSNLSYLLEVAAYETIILADSDIRVRPDYIATVVSPLADPKVGAVTCGFIGYHPSGLGAAIASFGRCFDFIPSVLIARALDGGLKFAIGATIATRKSILSASGGLVFNRIGSDYNLGKRIAQAGYQVKLSRYVLESNTGHEGVGEVFKRELRWARTIRHNRGLQYYSMMFCYGTVYSAVLLGLLGREPWVVSLVLITLGIRALQVLISIWQMRCPALLFWLWVLPIRDLLSALIFIVGGFGQNVYWRGRLLRIEADGLITEMH
jgi:ceramide glucosyltransferase